jgi:hypothetical protein
MAGLCRCSWAEYPSSSGTPCAQGVGDHQPGQDRGEAQSRREEKSLLPSPAPKAKQSDPLCGNLEDSLPFFAITYALNPEKDA